MDEYKILTFLKIVVTYTFILFFSNRIFIEFAEDVIMSEFEQGDLVEVVFEPNQRGVSFHSFCFFISEVDFEGDRSILTFVASIFIKSKRFCVNVRKDGSGEFYSCGSECDNLFKVMVRKIIESDIHCEDLKTLRI
jgi:hypothetical protein